VGRAGFYDPKPFQRFIQADNKKPLETVQVELGSLDHRAEATVLMRSLRVAMILFDQGLHFADYESEMTRSRGVRFLWS
jgi:hypothetical protein